MYLLNAISLNMLEGTAALCCCRINDIAAKARLDGELVSVVGHKDTAAVFSNVLGMDVPMNRETITLEPGDEAVVGQYKGPRLSEGATELPEGATIQWWLVKVGSYRPLGEVWQSKDGTVREVGNRQRLTCVRGDRIETIIVNEGGEVEVENDCSPNVVVNKRGTCRCRYNSSPVVTVRDGGICIARDDSTPEVHVMSGGKCIAWERSKPRVFLEKGGTVTEAEYSKAEVTHKSQKAQELSIAERELLSGFGPIDGMPSYKVTPEGNLIAFRTVADHGGYSVVGRWPISMLREMLRIANRSRNLEAEKIWGRAGAQMDKHKTVKLQDAHPGGFHAGVEVALCECSETLGFAEGPFLTGFRPTPGPQAGMFGVDREPIQVIERHGEEYIFTMANLGEISREEIDTLLANGEIDIDRECWSLSIKVCEKRANASS